MILVGYDNESSNYRVMDPRTLKITITRDVVFNEQNINENQEDAHINFSFESAQEEDIQNDIGAGEQNEI